MVSTTTAIAFMLENVEQSRSCLVTDRKFANDLSRYNTQRAANAE